MGFLRKKIKQIGRGIKKIGRKIGKAFKSVLKPFAKVFGKLGPLGSIAMMMVMPGIGQMMAGFGANLGGVVGSAIQFTGNAINYVASAPKKIFGSITDAMGRGFDALTGKTVSGGPSWFDNFKADFGKGSFDVSAAGQQRLLNIADKQGNLMGYDDSVQYALDTGELDDFAGSPAGKVTPSTVETITDASKESRTGVIGKGRDLLEEKVESISKTKIPGVGTIGDAAYATNAGLTAFNAYSSVSGTDLGEFGTAGDFGYQASDLLGPTTDQGGIYNMTAPTWSYDYNQSYINNMSNAQNTWNNHYGFGQGFDPSATPGYGYGYDQWLYESMGIRGAS